MLFKKRSGAKKSALQTVHQFVFVEVPMGISAPEVLAWGYGDWWPPSCRLRISKLTDGEVRLGSRYRSRLARPLGPAWTSEVTRLEGRSLVEWTFQKGLFSGTAVLRIGERANGTRIDYEMHYAIANIAQNILWRMVFQKKFEADLRQVMTALQEHLNRVFQEQTQQRFVGEDDECASE